MKMRTIKFRVIDVPPENLQNRKVTLIGYEALIEGTWKSIDAGKLMDWSKARCGLYSGLYWKRLQYIGVEDKNGNEIYEGDIIEIVKVASISPSDFIGRTYQVLWHEENGNWGGFILENQRYRKEKFRENASFVWYTGNNCRVIGNIYENPEFLKK